MFKLLQHEKKLFSINSLINIRQFCNSSSKKKFVLKVNVLDENGKILWNGTIDDAKKYAKKHNLQLINSEELNSNLKRQDVKLVPKFKALEEDDKTTNSKPTNKQKELKKVLLKESIADHDLEIKNRMIAQYLIKDYNVRLIINGFKMDLKMAVLDKIKSKFTPHIAFKQVISNSSSIKLVLIAESTFVDFYNENYSKKHNDSSNKKDYSDNSDDLIDNKEIEELVNENLSKK